MPGPGFLALSGIGSTYRGSWSSTLVYLNGDVVLGTDGNYYVSLVDHTNQNPVGSTGYWSVLAGAGFALSGLNPTPTIQTATYTANPGDLVYARAIGASIVITLPTAPPDKTQVGCYLLTTASGHTVTFAAGAGDLMKSTVTLQTTNQTAVLQYSAANKSWYAVSHVPTLITAIQSFTAPTAAGQIPVASGSGSYFMNWAAAPISVTSERIWLQDPTLPNGAADNTGVAFVNDAVNGAIQKALTAFPGNAPVVIAGAPGLYKWNTSPTASIIVNGPLALPSGVMLGGNGSPKSMQFTFPTDHTYPVAIGQNSAAITAGQATLPLQNVRNVFMPATPTNPVTAFFYGHPFTYTGITGTGANVTLTGCTGLVTTGGNPSGATCVGNTAVMLGSVGTASRGVWSSDSCVRFIGPGATPNTATPTPPPGHMDGVYVANQAGINSDVAGFRMNHVYAGDHETFGGDVYLGSGWCQYACMAPQGVAWPAVDSGNQQWRSGIICGGSYWCTHFVCTENLITGGTWEGQSHQGNSPWWMWKDVTVGQTGATGAIMTASTVYGVDMEAVTLGVVGAADVGSLLNIIFDGGGPYWDGVYPVAGHSGPVAVFQASCSGVTLRDFGGLSNAPLFIGDYFGGKLVASLEEWRTPYGGPMNQQSSGRTQSPWTAFLTEWGGMVSGYEGTINAGDLVQLRFLVNNNFPHAWAYQQFGAAGVFKAPAGIAATKENSSAAGGLLSVFYLVTNSRGGPTTANVVVRSTPPTAPTAVVSGTAGTRPAGPAFYRITAITAAGGETGPSTEVNVTLSGANSAALGWTAPTLPHGQVASGYRIYYGTATGAETGYFQVGNVLTINDTGQALTAKAVPTTNVGIEVPPNAAWVRGNQDAGVTGKVCAASGPYDPNGQVIGSPTMNYANGLVSDNGSTVLVYISPAFS